MRPVLLVLLFLGFSVTVCAGETRPPPRPAQTICPVSGRSVDGAHYADVEGFRIYTAGPAETEQVVRNPAKAFGAIAKNREAAVPIVWVCPSMRQGVSPEFPYVQQGGKRIYYCCAPCQPRIKRNFKAAADIMKQLAGQGS